MTYNDPNQGYNPQPGYRPAPPPPPGYRAGPGRGIPAEVNVASILLFIGGGFGVLGGLLLLAVTGGIFAAIGAVALIIGGAEIWVGVALRQLKPWARMAAIVLAAIGVVFAIVSLVKGGYTSVVSLGIDGYIIYALTRPNVVAAFPQSR